MIVTVELFDPTTERTTFYRKLPLMIGRHGSADYQLDDPAIPPMQCMIHKESGNLAVWNLRDDFPLLVNGQEISKAELSPGDVLTIGRHRLGVFYEILVPV